MKKEGIHYGRLRTSERLQRIMRVLADGQPHGTWELQVRARSCAVHSCVAELRAQGIPVSCTQTGRGLFVYQLGGQVPAKRDNRYEEALP